MLKRLNKIEPFVFLLVLIVNVAPVFGVKYFVTLDGGSHNNNVAIISSLLTDPSSICSSVYSINSELVPNWSGHFLLLILSYFFKYSIAEKILISIILILMPIFFRKIIGQIAPQNILFSYFFFPFTHYGLLYLGFYNFTIGVLFLTILISFWLKNHEKRSVYFYVILCFLFFAIYFSHLFIFIVSVLFIAVQILTTSNYKEEGSFKNILKRGLPILICALPFLYLTATYFLNRPAKQLADIQYLGANKIIQMIINGDAFSLDVYKEKAYSALFVLLLTFLFLLTAIQNSISVNHQINRKQKVLALLKSPGHLFLLMCLLMFILAFVMPNDDGYGGYITIRFVYLGFFFLLLFACFQKQPDIKTHLLLFSVLIFSYTNLMDIKKEGISERNLERKKLEPAFDKISPNSVVLHFNLTGRTKWDTGHLVENIGAEKRTLVLSNYEATKGYFPVVWNCSKNIHFKAGGYTIAPGNCQKLNIKETKDIDFVLVYGDKTGCIEYDEIVNRISDGYQVVYQSSSVSLFKKE